MYHILIPKLPHMYSYILISMTGFNHMNSYLKDKSSYQIKMTTFSSTMSNLYILEETNEHD